MTPADILCRCCQKDYSRAEGCAICEPAKRNCVWPAMQESEAADLVRMSRRVIKMLESQIRGIERHMDSAIGAVFDPALAREASALARSMAAVLTEARKLEEREEQRVKDGGFEDQLDIFIGWIGGLPREYIAKAFSRMEQLLLGPGAQDDAELIDG